MLHAFLGVVVTEKLYENFDKSSQESMFYAKILFNEIFKANSYLNNRTGVITQHVSCDLGVTKLQEGILGVVFYVTLALSYALAVPFSKRLLAALYIFGFNPNTQNKWHHFRPKEIIQWLKS